MVAFLDPFSQKLALMLRTLRSDWGQHHTTPSPFCPKTSILGEVKIHENIIHRVPALNVRKSPKFSHP